MVVVHDHRSRWPAGWIYLLTTARTFPGHQRGLPLATSEDINLAIDKGAVSQSETVKAEGSNADVLALADQIITAQQGEITEMQALLQG
ncbi:MAG TPA: hypothetical protein DCQ52_01615 [Acidimicrobiaceae bacterium]|nr:hypothetical protein [Acidimicrobiaceae bacterium]